MDVWGWLAIGAVFVAWMVARLLLRVSQKPARRLQFPPQQTASGHRFTPAWLFGPPVHPFVRRFRQQSSVPVVTVPPHAFPHRAATRGELYDLSQDGDPTRLAGWGLPNWQTPDQLADGLGLTVNRLAWLTHRCRRGQPDGTGPQRTHYHYRWIAKRSGGVRLLEVPKRSLRDVQRLLLKLVIEKIPPAASAHGFIAGRSIHTNALPHAGQAIVLKLDLRDFYATVSLNKVIALFRRCGYSREVAIWLGRLTTSVIPGHLAPPAEDRMAVWRYRRRHLPQGAPTSPALANLAAYGLDRRLQGMAEKWGITYTRYADDLTFSGPAEMSSKLRKFIPLVEQIIRNEGFHSNRKKRQVLRAHQRQIVTGVVVNERPGVKRADVDTLKAILHNCVQRGPHSQNRDGHANFAAHLRGRIAHIAQFRPERGARLLELYQRINWTH